MFSSRPATLHRRTASSRHHTQHDVSPRSNVIPTGAPALLSWRAVEGSAFSSLLCALCVPISVNGACPGPVGVLPSLFSFFFSSPHSSSHAATRMPYMDFPRCPARSTRSVLYSCKTTVSNDLLTLIFPLYSMNPSFLNLFMKKFTRDRVVPTMLARVSCDTFGSTLSGCSFSP